MTVAVSIAAIARPDAPAATGAAAVASPAAPAGGFASFLNDGIGYVENKVDHANAMVRAFAVDDSVPVHQVTMALADARLAVELAMQVRSRLVEAYRDLMTMQL